MLKNKKFLVSLLLLALVVIVSACGGGGEEEGSESGGDSGGETTTVQGNAEDGQEIYKANCLSCHGQEGAGASAPALTGGELTYDQIVQQVKNGGGGMPAFEDQLSEQEIADVSAYVAETLATMGE
ncbi:c-type cytochrome [Virgibacillus sp. DJP39]|uniref:c-type cytochrome n=1 Tax=Virgibacillus sp. DJP39 TaxID=3409790 RepID=UPI003BB50C4E